MANPMPDGEKPKQSRRQKAADPKRSAERALRKSALEKHAPHAAGKAETIAGPRQVVITESEYRALVAQKAYEIYMQRCAVSEVDDWLQAERIVKEALLAQGQTAGFV